MGKRPPSKSHLYFEVQADLGVTKHLGGATATEEIIRLCRMDQTKYILDMGCGTGKTPYYLAKRYGNMVVGVDISRSMLSKSRERIGRGQVGDKVTLVLADARTLPFHDEVFDVVIGESITSFIEDKDRAMREYVRVAKLGGCVTLNETTWIKTQPPQSVVDYVSQTTGAMPEAVSTWEELLLSCGLRDVRIETYKLGLLSDWVNEVRWLDLRDLLVPWFRLLPKYVMDPDYRRFVKSIRRVPKGYFEYFGYGLYVGRK